MAYIPQIRVKATYMRGGTSKGTFFNIADLPKEYIKYLFGKTSTISYEDHTLYALGFPTTIFQLLYPHLVLWL